ncbi:heavy-metal-associated domain-containing protein [Citrobacter gillenii]|jgi:mercuric ion binding protein|uniref:Heavy-metal-associated domain-containing protein n=1 Tax=Citrobacter gillenii TaxID=67828 RepID=A0ABD6M3L7_9ENTR|nr:MULTISPECIES: heavy metal-associated domain-containing protein [Citrobacter freundii complex]NTZ51155.1 heavy-metal-associated domain-containing protein [Citrobacter gillenii]QMR47454.1 heavy-metal-associated domain-containing protein [Citrobacter freundii]
MKKIMLLGWLLLPLWVQAANQKVVLDIQNMTCSLCVISVNQALRETDGVIKAKSSLKTRQAEAIVPHGFSTDTLLNAVAKTGYTATLNRIEQQ